MGRSYRLFLWQDGANDFFFFSMLDFFVLNHKRNFFVIYFGFITDERGFTSFVANDQLIQPVAANIIPCYSKTELGQMISFCDSD